MDEKSNEITAPPDLLRSLAVAGCVVTIDAMGCQRPIARQILDQEGTYVLALKENQRMLHANVRLSFATAHAETFEGETHDTAETVETGHGRIETRQTWVISDPVVVSWLQEQHDWPGLEATGMVRGEQRIGSERPVEDRYYLLSSPLSASAFGQVPRSHWGIENHVHCVLDVTFHEDRSRIRAGYAAENLAVFRHIALNLLRHQSVERKSITGRQHKAAWDTTFLLQSLSSV